MKRRTFLGTPGALAAHHLSAPAIAAGTRTLRFAPQAGLSALDPIWTTAAVVQNHGYTCFDTLYGIDATAQQQPQMAAGHELSADGRSWTFRLRPAWSPASAAAGGTVQTYMAMRARKQAYATAVARWFDDWDLLLTPSAAVAAFPAERLMPADRPQHPWDWMTSWAEFSYPFDIAHNPAISVPCGFTASGLPVGVQIVGRRLDDAGVLRAAHVFESARPRADRLPPMALIRLINGKSFCFFFQKEALSSSRAIPPISLSAAPAWSWGEGHAMLIFLPRRE